MDILTSVASEIGKLLLIPVQRHVGYLLFSDQNVKNLSSKVEKLILEKNDVEKDVATALRRGEVIRDMVQEWLTEAETIESDTKDIVNRVEGTKRCLWCLFPLRLRYRLGKKAAKNIGTIDELLREGIFNRVSHEPPPPSTDCLLVNEDFFIFDSTRESINHILDALRASGANTIGVHGMGGVGKTAVIKEVAKQAKKEKLFDEVLMATVSQNPNITRIQTEIAEQLDLKISEESTLVRAAKLSNRLKGVKRSLIILDDIWERLELKEVGIPHGLEHPGCKVALTTRKKDICNTMECQKIVEIKVLSNQESWELFKFRVAEDIETPTLHQVATNVVMECRGLPLAIATLGWALRKKNVDIWKGVLQQLKISMPKDIPGLTKQVFNSIRLSFKFLESDEIKSCFLHCCLYPEDYNIEIHEFTRHVIGVGLLQDVETLDEAQQRVKYMFEGLKASNLLIEGTKATEVKMHDVVRDVAIWIASEKEQGFYVRASADLSEWPRRAKLEECQRLSLMENKIVDLPDKQHCPKLQMLLLSKNKGLRKIPGKFFREMKAIAVLDLSWTAIPSLPRSISCLTNLSTLCLEGCRALQDLSPIGKLKKLEVLNLGDCRLQVFPEEIGQLINLRCLDLTGWGVEVPVNIILRLQLLEHLYVPGGLKERKGEKGDGELPLQNVNTAFAELAQLKYLTVLFIRVNDARCLAEDINLGPSRGLTEFHVSAVEYRESLGRHGRKMHLSISEPLASWVKALLSRTLDLELYSCDRIEYLISGQGEIPRETFINLNSLGISHTSTLRKLCDGPLPDGCFESLRVFVVALCGQLTNIFPSDILSRMNRLEKLRITYSYNVQQIFDYDYSGVREEPPMLLPGLRTMQFWSLHNMVSIWKGVVPHGSLANLEKIELESCEKLSFMFPPTTTFPRLREVSISRCDSLTGLFSMEQMRDLQLLEKIDIAQCEAMKSIIMFEVGDEEVEEDQGMLPQLRRIELRHLPSLTSFNGGRQSLFDWPALEYVSVIECGELKRLPIGTQSVPKLEKLEGSEDWFNGLEWENEDIKLRVGAIFHPIEQQQGCAMQ